VTNTAQEFAVNIEGTLFEWDRETITAEEIRELAGFEPRQQIVEVDLKDNTERTIGEDEVIDLKPGQGFGKKVRFQRG
jgi:Multiubiquitin